MAKKLTSYVSKALQNSMVTGIPQIASARNVSKRVIRTFIFVFCMLGFLYQVFTFLNLYWEYHTILDVQISSPKKTNLPAITICNRNGIYSSKVCQKMKLECLNYSNNDKNSEFCKCHPRYCKSTVPLRKKLLFPQEEELLPLLPLPQKDVEDMLQPFKDLMLNCEGSNWYEGKWDVRCNFTNLLSVRSPSGYKQRNVCYTMFSLVGKPDSEPESVLSSGSLDMEFNPRVEEYPLYVPEVSLQIAFHHSRALANPYVSGFSLPFAGKYTVALKKVVKRLLPEPYETKCVDYLKIWKENGGYGVLSEADCIQECLANASLEVLKCIPEGVFYPSNEAYCTDKTVNHEVMNAAHQCTRQCGPACWQQQFILTIGKTSGVDGGDQVGGEQNLMSTLFNNMETTSHIYKPKYEFIEVFSYIGGYVGIWLGISLLAVLDFAETLVILAKYYLAKLMSRRLRRKRRTTTIVRISHS